MELEKVGSLWKVKNGSELHKACISTLHRYWGTQPGSYFPGPQPVSIERRHFHLLKENDYLVCEKTDGVRNVMICFMYNEKKMCVLMNRSFECTLYPLNLPRTAFQGTVLDGELIGKDYLVYDAVAVSGESVAKLGLLDRMEASEQFIKGILKLKTDPIVVRLKIMHLFAEFPAFLEHYKTLTNVDGIILTPINEPIRTGTHETLFKWKPRDLNTIDFQMKKGDLYVQDKNELIFESRLDKVPDWLTEDAIVECQYVNKKWKPLNLRTDKKHPNSRRTFYRTLKNISEDIQIEEFSALV